jgi:hypothetical protein
MKNGSLKIITVCYNTPNLIEPQYRSFVKNIKDDFDYVVYDTTHTHELTSGYTSEVIEICNRLGIRRIEVPIETYRMVSKEGDVHYPQWDTSQRAGKGITFAIQNSIEGEKGRILLVDIDVFAIRPIQISDYYDWDMVGIPSVRMDKYGENIFYFTNQIFLINSEKINDHRMIDFGPCMINETNLDCGGKLYYLFKIQPELTYKAFTNCLQTDPSNELLNTPEISEFRRIDYDIINSHIPQVNDYIEIFDYSLLHFRSGTNWINLSNNSSRTDYLIGFLNNINK